MSLIEKIEEKADKIIFREKLKKHVSYTKVDYSEFQKTDEYRKRYKKEFEKLLKEKYESNSNQDKLKRLDEMLHTEITLEYAIERIEESISKDRIYFNVGNNLVGGKIKLDNLEEYRSWIDKGYFLTITEVKKSKFSNITNLIDLLYEERFIFFDLANNVEILWNDMTVKKIQDFNFPKISDEVVNQLNEYFTSSKVIQLIFSNPRYLDLKKNFQMNHMMLKEIPKDYTLLYPQARMLKRHFVLHIGDTNTGKTYEALQELKQAESGTYLAPLRLLALEIQERMNEEGVPCSMTTGEEEDIIPEAKHMSSTVEKLDISKYYDVCVIDEAQMIEDKDRGWAWTNAILGAYSERIHICMSENARDVVIQLIRMCHDTYEIVEHQRNTPIQFQSKIFNFKTDIQEHDALIVFSRKKVLSVATELRHRGIEASVIYGALPYSVRKNEIRKFIEGETKVVVSTDAIGMGMNLPIKRIVFLETSKYDGKNTRSLFAPEVKQIAGRAGRRGMFDTGYIASMLDVKMMQGLFSEKYEQIKHAKIQLPKTLINLDIKLSDIIYNWCKIPDNGVFEKSDMEHDMKLCKILEANIDLPKETMLDLISIPFDEKFQELEDLWFNLVMCHFKDGDIFTEMELPEFNEKSDLEWLELTYKKFDLYYSFARTIHYNKNDFISIISKLKEEVAIYIMQNLQTKEIHRQCRICGRAIPWDHPYSICEKCYRKRNKNMYW